MKNGIVLLVVVLLAVIGVSSLEGMITSRGCNFGVGGKGSTSEEGKESMDTKNSTGSEFVIIVRKNDYYNGGKKIDLEDVVEKAKNWYQNNKEAIVISDDDGSSGAWAELTKELKLIPVPIK